MKIGSEVSILKYESIVPGSDAHQKIGMRPSCDHGDVLIPLGQRAFHCGFHFGRSCINIGELYRIITNSGMVVLAQIWLIGTFLRIHHRKATLGAVAHHPKNSFSPMRVKTVIQLVQILERPEKM